MTELLVPGPSDRRPSDIPASTSHRRIDLQSPQDLIYLQSNAQRAARAKIDLHLPLEAALREGAAGTDELRRGVEAEVDAFIANTFDSVKKGICVAGVDGEAVDWMGGAPEEFEPFDTALAQRITDLYATIEALNLDLADTRRAAAKKAAGDFRERSAAQASALEARFASAEGAVDVEGDAKTEMVKIGFEGREQEVQRIWEEALASMNSLRKDLPETTQRAEQALDVVGYFEGK